jgi:hypothetical protein
MSWIFYNSSGQRLTSAATSISVLDIDGATDIGAAIVDADLFIIDDGAGGTNRKTAASRIKTYVAAPSQATQSAIEARTNEDTYAPPDLMHHHPGVAKGWVRIAAAGTIVSGDYNVASITDTGTGHRVIVWDADFADTNYAVLGHSFFDSGAGPIIDFDAANIAVGSIPFRIRTSDATYSVADVASSNMAFGDQ